jgi:hypothetical protein
LSIPTIDPSTDGRDFAEFCDVIRRAFGSEAEESTGPSGGVVWRWARRGLWTITAGAVLHPEPVLAGPAGEWRIARADRTGATYALLVLSGADALPPGVETPRPGRPAPSSATYAAGVRIPDAVRPAAPGADPERGGFRPGPRPHYREPGANTGATPGASFGSRNLHRHIGDQADLPLVGMGPGAAYAPRVIRDDRMPALDNVPATDRDAERLGGSDLPPRDAHLPAGVDDLGRNTGAFPVYETTTTAWPPAPASGSPWSSPPAPAEDRPAYSPPPAADTSGGGSSSPAPSGGE